MRSYREYCSVAKALDVVGDRWTLLILRELAINGPRRYTDLRNGLPGIATNLLAQRLRELEQEDIVSREEAPPPVATTLFSLGARGEQLMPVLDELSRWGLPLMTDQDPHDAVRSHWLAFAIERILTDRAPEREPVTVELRTGDQPIVVEMLNGAVRTHLGAAEHPDARLSGPPRPVLGLLFGLIDPADAHAVGVSYEGDPKTLRRMQLDGLG